MSKILIAGKGNVIDTHLIKEVIKRGSSPYFISKTPISEKIQNANFINYDICKNFNQKLDFGNKIPDCDMAVYNVQERRFFAKNLKKDEYEKLKIISLKNQEEKLRVLVEKLKTLGEKYIGAVNFANYVDQISKKKNKKIPFVYVSNSLFNVNHTDEIYIKTENTLQNILKTKNFNLVNLNVSCVYVPNTTDMLNFFQKIMVKLFLSGSKQISLPTVTKFILEVEKNPDLFGRSFDNKDIIKFVEKLK